MDAEDTSFLHFVKPYSGENLPFIRNEASILSPLRFPGAKRRLAGYIHSLIKLNDLHPSLYVEPFAGGASVALQLLNDGVVEKIGLADLDPLIASFWKAVFFDSDWLVEQVRSIEINLKQWSYFKHNTFQTNREQALACLFLNRTSFSGILAPSAGPIGGHSQRSIYAIDCRFPRETLVKRIKQAASLADKVEFVWNLPWASTISRAQSFKSRKKLQALYYFDPPYMDKAHRLYSHWFRESDHASFRDKVTHIPDPWVVSYDLTGKISELYSGYAGNGTRVELLYSSSAKRGHYTSNEILLTNLSLLPKESRLWRQSKEWNRVNGTKYQPNSR